MVSSSWVSNGCWRKRWSCCPCHSNASTSLIRPKQARAIEVKIGLEDEEDEDGHEEAGLALAPETRLVVVEVVEVILARATGEATHFLLQELFSKK